MSRRILIEDFYQTIWIAGDVDQMGRFFAPQAQSGGLTPGFELDPADIVILVQTVLALVSGQQVRVLRVIEEGDWVSALVHVSAKLRSSGDPVGLNGQFMARVVDGRFAEVYNHFDTMAFFQQIGAVSPDAVERALAEAAA